MAFRKLGIIGAGMIAEVHAVAAQRIGATIGCIANRTLANADELAAKVGAEATVSDIDEMLAIDDIDGVIVGVPNALHKDLAIKVLEAGKDVLVEKPLGLNAAECDAIIAAAERSDAIVQVGMVARFAPPAAAAKQFIDAGRLGDVYHAKANYYRRRGIPGLGGWFTTKAKSGGGPLIDLGVHVIDTTMFLMGFPKPLRVSGRTFATFGPRMGDYLYEEMHAGPPTLDGEFDVEDFGHALVRFEGGATLEINAAWAGNFPEGSVTNLLGLFGDRGGLSFEHNGDTLRLAAEVDGHNADIVPALPDADPFDAQLRAFIHACETRGEPPATAQQARTVQAIIDAVYRSSDEGREVEIQ